MARLAEASSADLVIARRNVRELAAALAALRDRGGQAVFGMSAASLVLDDDERARLMLATSRIQNAVS